MAEIRKLIVRMAKDNLSWGYTRIQGALANLNHKVGCGTIAKIFKEHGIEPATERGQRTSWAIFLKAHWNTITATDFFTVEVWTLKGFVTQYVLFVIDIAARSVKIAGITGHPNQAFMKQIAMNLTDDKDGFLNGKRHLILDRDTKFSADFRELLKREGKVVIRLPPRSPNLNAFVERFIRSIKEECIGRLIFFGEKSLRHALREYMVHYHAERNHQGINNRLIKPAYVVPLADSRIPRSDRLSGLLMYYHRIAA